MSKYRISCDVCMDLIPLVKDDIASKDSKNLVMEHIETCKSCYQVYYQQPIVEQIDPNDNKILFKIKKRIFFVCITFIVLGILLGITITNTMNVFYNALIMPAVGGMSYLLFRKKAFFISLSLGIVAFLLQGILQLFVVFLDNSNFMFTTLFVYIGIYAFFSLVGICIAMLLEYAFRRD